MRTNFRRAPLAAAAFACLSASAALAQTPAAAGPWAKVPALPTTCFQSIATNQPDPFYARLEAAKTAIAADIDRQQAINAKIEEDFNNIDPMEKAQRMQQWMMSNPQEAMAFMQAAQAAPAQASQELESLEQQRQSREAEWNALKKSYEDARIAAYAPAEARRKVLAGKLGYEYGSPPKDLVNPFLALRPTRARRPRTGTRRSRSAACSTRSTRRCARHGGAQREIPCVHEGAEGLVHPGAHPVSREVRCAEASAIRNDEHTGGDYSRRPQRRKRSANTSTHSPGKSSANATPPPAASSPKSCDGTYPENPKKGRSPFPGVDRPHLEKRDA